ncbi:MAG: hypothetical protein ACQEXQ_13770 [Bacillota bacterium]
MTYNHNCQKSPSYLQLSIPPLEYALSCETENDTARYGYALLISRVRAGEQTDVPLTFREAMLDVPVLGTMVRNNPVTMLDGTNKTLEHLIREISELAEPFAELGAPIVLVVGDSEWTASFDPSSYPKLPSCAMFVRDSTYASLPDFISRPPANEAGFPHLFVLDGQDRIRYTASGYKIGTGKEALQILTGVWQQPT